MISGYLNRKLCGVRWVKPHNNCEGAYNMLIMSRQSHSILLWTEGIDQSTASLLNMHKALRSSPHVWWYMPGTPPSGGGGKRIGARLSLGT